MRELFWTVGVILFLSSCKTQPLPEVYRISDALSESNDPSFMVVADPQIHNLYGNPLYQTLKLSDKIVQVAIRPPELNILAPYSLTYFLEQGLLANKQDQLTLVLGDATNIACSSEYNTFKNAMDKGVGDKGLWLMAHGNHDTYLIGMVNSYKEINSHKKRVYTDQDGFWPPKTENGWPVDKSWWKKMTGPTGRGWSNACLQPEGAGESSPMNKLRWLVKYRDHLKQYDIDLISENKTLQISTDNFGNEYYEQIVTAKVGSEFKGHQYFVKGKMYLPKANKEFVKNQAFHKNYMSYFVQAYDLDENNRILLIDTSVCGNIRVNINFKSENAGSRGCLGEDQLKDIKEMLSSANEDEKNWIIAGHFPLNAIKESDLLVLKNHLNSAVKNSKMKSWTYISAHTHSPLNTIFKDGGVEINVGSTTDWPMEANRFSIISQNGQISNRKSFYVAEKIEKTSKELKEFDNWAYTKELCRHLPTARALVNHKVGESWEPIIEFEPDCSKTSKDRWTAKANELTSLLKELDGKMMANPVFKMEMLGIMATTARKEAMTFAILK